MSRIFITFYSVIQHFSIEQTVVQQYGTLTINESNYGCV